MEVSHYVAFVIVGLAVQVDSRGVLILLLLRLDFLGEEFFEEVGKADVDVFCNTVSRGSQNTWAARLTTIGLHYDRPSTERALVLAFALHDNEASNTKDMLAS